MKIRASWMVVFAMLGAATLAHADSVTLTLLPPTTTYAGGAETLTYAATVAALSTNGASVYLNGDALNIQSPLSRDDTDFYVDFPLSVNPGTSFTGNLFTITIPAGTASAMYPGSFTLLGGSNPGAYNSLATVQFSVAVTPEPPTVVLLLTGLMVTGIVMWRKRFNGCAGA